MEELLNRLIEHFAFLAPQNGLTRLSGGSNSGAYRVGQYVVKISTLPDKDQFEREAAVMDRLRDKICVPRVLVVDTSRQLIPMNFLIQSYVPGPLLADCWDDLTKEDKRRNLIHICDQIEAIHDLTRDSVPPLRGDQIAWYLDECAQRGIPNDISKKLSRFVQAHAHLAGRNAVVTHGDLQFYNMIRPPGGHDVYFIDFDSVFSTAPEREILALAHAAYRQDASATRYIIPSYIDNMAMVRAYRPDWFVSDELVAAMRLFAVPRVCYMFDCGLNPRPSESEGRLQYQLLFEDPIWERYMRGEAIDRLM